MEGAPGDVTGFWPLFSALVLFSPSGLSLYSSALSFFCDFLCLCHTEFIYHCCQCSFLSGERVKNLSYLKRNNCTHLFLRIINRIIIISEKTGKLGVPAMGWGTGASVTWDCPRPFGTYLWYHFQ